MSYYDGSFDLYPISPPSTFELSGPIYLRKVSSTLLRELPILAKRKLSL